MMLLTLFAQLRRIYEDNFTLKLTNKLQFQSFVKVLFLWFLEFWSSQIQCRFVQIFRDQMLNRFMLKPTVLNLSLITIAVGWFFWLASSMNFSLEDSNFSLSPKIHALFTVMRLNDNYLSASHLVFPNTQCNIQPPSSLPQSLHSSTRIQGKDALMSRFSAKLNNKTHNSSNLLMLPTNCCTAKWHRARVGTLCNKFRF